jgi:hypothetical protein
VLFFGALNGFIDQGLGHLGIVPVTDLDPLAWLEILVMLEEMLNLVERDFGQV